MGRELLLQALVEDLRTVGDPDAADAQIETVTTEADERVTAAADDADAGRDRGIGPSRT